MFATYSVRDPLQRFARNQEMLPEFLAQL